ncbi:MAG: TonB-dependent receptor, partial [Desulfobacteraceae bacterium]|nr:TonB-dependent receptor [Desulfobacteraceae bacterium]
INSGQFLQAQGAPAYFHTRPDVRKTGIFVNDTIVLDRLSVTPGLRYDHHSESGSFLSPSLGLAYTLGNETILRGSVARGFTAPPLSWTSGGALGLAPNPSLEEETVWSYQAGVESASLRYVWLKGTVFRHEIDDTFKGTASTGNNTFINNGDSRRQGFEIEAETLPLYHTSLEAGWTYVDLNPANDFGAENMYTYNIGITYDHPDIVRAELYGHYIWWDAQKSPDYKHDDFIWDLNVRKEIYTSQSTRADLFATIHNLFNGSQYLNTDNPNPDRWVEAGLKMHF